jgi:hypothetical protein
VTFLADTSIVIRLRQGREIEERWVDAVTAGLVGVCPAAEAELVRATLSKADRDALRAHLRSLFGWHPMPDDAWRFVEPVQDCLVDLGQHKGSWEALATKLRWASSASCWVSKAASSRASRPSMVSARSFSSSSGPATPSPLVQAGRGDPPGSGRHRPQQSQHPAGHQPAQRAMLALLAALVTARAQPRCGQGGVPA